MLARPKDGDKKEVIRDWLEQKKNGGLDIPEDVSILTKLTKVQLMEIVKRLTNEEDGEPQTPRTKVQQLAKKYGHRVLLIPPYNPDLNPIGKATSLLVRPLK